MQPFLSKFVAPRPEHVSSQAETLEWMAVAHAESEAAQYGLDGTKRDELATRLRTVIGRCACGPDKLAWRGHSLGELDGFDWSGHSVYPLRSHPFGVGSAQRTRMFGEIVDRYFVRMYADETVPPDDLLHVTCTGYESPSGAQRLVSARGWGASTRVTHAYQMGCYAAVPALRIASGMVATGSRQVDIAHTELCTLHMDPSNHSLEQLVVQSLFSDGVVRYTMSADGTSPGLRVLALHEEILPQTADEMTWLVGDTGMHMTLARDVPQHIASVLRGFVSTLLAKDGRGVADLKRATFAVHPGGPRILDGVRDVLELGEHQLAASRRVLFDHGNMSSATLPHIWMRIVDDPAIPAGTLVPSLAFGPGLSVCGALLEKV